jgi:putative salt-induced outer membrane protein
MKKCAVGLLIVGFLFVWATPAFAQEEEPLDVWRGSVDLSLITATGNSKTQTGSARMETSKKTVRDRWIGRAGALYGKSDGEKTAQYFYANGEYNYFHSPKTYSIYFLGWEKDKLAGLDGRITGRVGLGHEYFKNDQHFLAVEGNVGYVYENEADDTQGYPEGRLYGIYEHYFSKTAMFFQTLEYLQDLGQLRNYRVNSTTGLKLAINTQWSLKTALTIRYDHEPAEGFRETDTITETALVYTF